MVKAVVFDPSVHTVGLNRDLSASLVPATPDPPIPVDGVTIGVVSMSGPAPHGGEMHPDGDEVLYLISGWIKVRLETAPVQEMEIEAGGGLIVPRGVWHTVDILEPSRIAYVTPGPNHQFRPPAGRPA